MCVCAHISFSMHTYKNWYICKYIVKKIQKLLVNLYTFLCIKEKKILDWIKYLIDSNVKK